MSNTPVREHAARRSVVLLDTDLWSTAELFDTSARERLDRRFRLIEKSGVGDLDFYGSYLTDARFVLGRPSLMRSDLTRCSHLKAVIDPCSEPRTDVAYADCERLGVRMLCGGISLARSVAEHGLGMTLSLLRDIHGGHDDMRHGRERFGPAGAVSHRGLFGSEVGFVGFGAVGRTLHQLIAPMCRKVRANDPARSVAELRELGVRATTIDKICRRSDIVFMVAPATPTGAPLLTAEHIAAMKPGASLLLLGRASTVDIDAMSEACRSGRIRAGMDVFPIEPLPLDHSLRSVPNLLLSPHRGCALTSAMRQFGSGVVEDLERMSDGLAPRNCRSVEVPLDLTSDLDWPGSG